MGRGCQGDLARSQGQRWSLSAYMGGKGGRKGGRHTRWFNSGDPVSTACVKKRREGKEKTSTGPSKTRGKKGELYLPLNEPPSFLSPSCDFPSVLSLSRSLFPPISQIFQILFLFFFLSLSLSLSLSSASPHLSHSVFPSLPSIDTVSTNSKPPVVRQERASGEGLPGTE